MAGRMAAVRMWAPGAQPVVSMTRFSAWRMAHGEGRGIEQIRFLLQRTADDGIAGARHAGSRGNGRALHARHASGINRADPPTANAPHRQPAAIQCGIDREIAIHRVDEIRIVFIVPVPVFTFSRKSSAPTTHPRPCHDLCICPAHSGLRHAGNAFRHGKRRTKRRSAGAISGASGFAAPSLRRHTTGSKSETAASLSCKIWDVAEWHNL